MIKKAALVLFASLFVFTFCIRNAQNAENDGLQQDSLSVEETEEVKPKLTPDDIKIVKDLKYDQHTLEDTYPYKDTTRQFQWEKIRARLFVLDSIQQVPANWAILRNYKNINGEAPVVRNYERNAYGRVSDTLGVERYQSVPLYIHPDSVSPEIYGRDGSLVKVLHWADSAEFAKIEPVYAGGDWHVPVKYIKTIHDTVSFHHAIFVDRINQNIATLEKTDTAWVVRSMNPATTGVHRPPYAQEMPEGYFVLQEKKAKMIFLKDGSSETGGYAPWASRFTNGAYIHGVPVNVPRTAPIEYSATLGTIPRSHMCVRNATSHAKFIYDTAPADGTIIFVFD